MPALAQLKLHCECHHHHDDNGYDGITALIMQVSSIFINNIILYVSQTNKHACVPLFYYAIIFIHSAHYENAVRGENASKCACI